MDGRWVLGVDIGGTNLVVALVPTAGGPPIAVRRRETLPGRGPDAAVADIAAMAEQVIAYGIESAGGSSADVVGVGIGCPGPLDLEAGLILRTPNLPWSGYPIRDRISDAVALPASLNNDGNCATYGEWWVGAGKGAESLVCVTLGTGVGGGFIEGGRLMRGASGSALEIGHMTIDVHGRRCACGNLGCLEAYASGPNLAARAREAIEAGHNSTLRGLVDSELERISAADVYQAALQGDDLAARVLGETARFLGVGLANLVNTFNPERIVLVGGVTAAGDHLLAPVRSEVRSRAFESAAEVCTIVPGALPETAGVIGAAGVYLLEQGR